MRLKTILIVLMALMFLTANTVTGVFHESVLTKETKLVHDGESPQTTRATDGDSILNQKELNKTSDFSNAKTEENVARSWSPNIFPFDSFVKDISTHKTDMWHDFAKIDGDSAELVVGLNNAQPDSYVKISDLIVENGGKLVNTVSTEDEVIAVVADLPLDLVSSFTEDVQASNLARYIEPNMKYQTQLVPNDPYWSLQWGPQKIEADYAWNTTIGDSSVLVAVIDTGIDYDHPDLVANYVALGYDWVNGDSDPIDDEGHGTHCAGIIAAELNNEIGVAGVAQVRIMAEKGLNEYGGGYEDDLANAIIHAVKQSADILSNSWGGYGESMLIYDAVKYAYDNGVLVVAAAGNEAWNNKLYPAAYDEVIAVTATDDNDDPASFTNFGEWVEVAAPGVEIYSTVLNDSYTLKSGTSMACPHVSGVAALIWSQFPNMTRDQVRAQLWYTTDDLGDPGFDEYYGYGRINTRRAVEQAPPEHDLLIFDWEKPKYIQPGDLASFKITVLNFGTSNEVDITVQLLVDSNVIDSKSIGSLTSGTSTTVDVEWNAISEGTFNVTAWVVPVPDENNIANNGMSAYITVQFITLALFKNVDPWGFLSNEEVLSLNNIPYAVFSSDDFGRVNLTNILRIIIASDQDQTFYDAMDAYRWWFENYVSGGGALEIHAADLGWNGGGWIGTLPGGLSWVSYYAEYVSIVDLVHPVMTTPNLITDKELDEWHYSLHGYFNSYPVDSRVVLIEDSKGYPAYLEFEFGAGAIVASSQTLEWAYWHGYSRILENSLLYSPIKYPHELVATLEAPAFLMPSDSSLLNATVHNRGLNNETDVELQLLINGTGVESETIPLLKNGTSFTIDYPWTPTIEGIYNVTAYAPPVADENITRNNKATKFVTVTYPLINPVEGQWANYTIHYYEAGRLIGVGHWNFTYDHYVEPHLIYVTLWVKDPSGYIGTEWMIVNIMNRWVESGAWAGSWYPGWIETDITVGSTINLLDGTATVNSSRIIPVGIYPIDCWEISWMYGTPYIFWYDKVSGLWIGMDVPVHPYRMELRLVGTNIPIGTTYEHELAVTLEAPNFLEPSDHSLLNATVHNVGLNNETNVNLSILINGTQVASITIPELLSGTSHPLNHSWTPTIEAMYNLTTYVLPLPEENFTVNNVATRMVRVRKIIAHVVFEEAHLPAYTIGINPAGDVTGGYAEFARFLTANGYLVSTIDPGTIIDPNVLAPIDILVIVAPQNSYSISELDAIEAWVKAGGKLLLISDWGGFSNVPSTIAARFNISLPGDMIHDLDENVGGNTFWPYYDGANLLPHPITIGVTRVEMYASDGIASAPADEIRVIITDSDGTATWNDGSPALAVPVMSAFDGGTASSGRLIIITDSNIWDSAHDIDFDGDIDFYDSDNEILALNSVNWLAVRYEHELVVSLEAPDFLEHGDSSLLNATVYNIGLINETDVELQLLINGTQVGSVTILELPNGTSYTIGYLWTPMVAATYNVTAYALPVLGENITINNAVTRLVNVRTVKGYVLFDQTHWTDSIFNYNIWVTDLIDRGYIVDTLTTSPITQPMLEKYDIFVIPQAHDYYSSDELSTIRNFVLNGGGLLVIGDDEPYIYTDITGFAGITWDWGGYQGYTKDITPHPVTKGVTTVYLPSPMSEMYVASPAQDIIRDNYGNVMLAVSEVGLGAVVGIADEDSIRDYFIGYAGNQRLANNMIDWLKSRRPVASFTYSPLDPYVGEIVAFDASASYDPDGTIVSYIWNFGDNSSGEGNTTTHLYAAGGTYTVTLTVIDNENLNSNSTTEITVSRTTIDIEIDVGSTHFRGEIAEFYILVSTLGNPINASISATLYYNGTIYRNLSASIEHMGSGFYRIPYTIPVDDSTGTYALLVEARYLSLSGVSLKSFLLSPTLTEWNAWLIDIQGDIATIKTDIGTIKVSLEDINLRLEDIEECLPFQKTIVATIDTEIGVIWVDLADINAVLTSIDGRIATVDTDIGLMQVDISKINAELITLSGTTATIKSDLGTITTDIANIRLKVTEISEGTATIETTFGTFTGEVTSIEKDIAMIETDFGTVKVNIGNIEEIPSTYAVPLNLVLLSWIIIAAGAILLAVFLRRKRS